MSAGPALDVRPRVRRAAAAGEPVVALESTVFAHGLPPPHDLEAAALMEAAVRREGAEPATVGLLDGRLIVGLDAGEIERLARSEGVRKASRRDLAPIAAAGEPAATTVAATLVAARAAGIALLATGGIGGVHRHGETTLDLSADLTELARTPVAVVCAGAKSVLDLARTLEVLETLGVPVVGYRTGELPAFYARRSGLPLPHRVDGAVRAALLLAAHWRGLGLEGGVLFTVPPPAAAALSARRVERLVDEAVERASAAGIAGKDLTPFLLRRLAEASGGDTVRANLALLERNARVAARIAVAYAARSG